MDKKQIVEQIKEEFNKPQPSIQSSSVLENWKELMIKKHSNFTNLFSLLIDFGASHTLVGLINKEINNLSLLQTDNIQNGLLPSILYLKPNLTFSFNSTNAIYVFDDLKANFINQKEYKLDLILKKQENIKDSNEAQKLYDKFYFDISSSNSFLTKNYKLSDIIHFEYDETTFTFTLKLMISLSINLVLAIFFNLIKEEVFIKNQQKTNIVMYSYPVYLNSNLLTTFKNIFLQADLNPLFAIDEATASVLCYNPRLSNNATYLVIDSGDKTTDLSLVKKDEFGALEVIAMDGSNHCGGNEINEGIINLWLRKYGVLPHNLLDALLKAKIWLNNPKHLNQPFFYYEKQVEDTQTYRSISAFNFDNLTQDEFLNNDIVKTLKQIETRQKEKFSDWKRNNGEIEIDEDKYQTINENGEIVVNYELIDNYKKSLQPYVDEIKKQLNSNESDYIEVDKYLENHSIFNQQNQNLKTTMDLNNQNEEINLNNNQYFLSLYQKDNLSLSNDYLTNTKQVYFLDYTEYILCASSFFSKYLALLDNFDNTNYDGIILSGGSNLNLFLQEEISQKTNNVFKEHIFDAVINGLANGFKKLEQSQYYVSYKTPIQVQMSLFKNEDKEFISDILVPNKTILPYKIKKTFTLKFQKKFISDCYLGIYLGLTPFQNKTLIATNETLANSLVNLSYTMFKPINIKPQVETILKRRMELNNSFEFNNEESFNVDVKIELAINEDFVFELKLQVGDISFKPIKDIRSAFTLFNQVYFLKAQEKLTYYQEIYQTSIQASNIKLLSEYAKLNDEVINVLELYDLIDLSLIVSETNDISSIKKVFNGHYDKLKQYLTRYKELLQEVNEIENSSINESDKIKNINDVLLNSYTELISNTKLGIEFYSYVKHLVDSYKIMDEYNNKQLG